MAVIQIGQGGALKSNTCEGQLHELCAYLQIGENTVDSNPNSLDNITGIHFQNSATFTGNFTIPVQQAINSSGQVIYSAVDYLSNFQFSPGIEGTFKSNTCTGYFMEVIIYIQNLESNSTYNPEKRNYVTGNFNSDSTTFSGSINLPINVNIDQNGGVVYTAKEYLLTPII